MGKRAANFLKLARSLARSHGMEINNGHYIHTPASGRGRFRFIISVLLLAAGAAARGANGSGHRDGRLAGLLCARASQSACSRLAVSSVWPAGRLESLLMARAARLMTHEADRRAAADAARSFFIVSRLLAAVVLVAARARLAPLRLESPPNSDSHWPLAFASLLARLHALTRHFSRVTLARARSLPT